MPAKNTARKKWEKINYLMNVCVVFHAEAVQLLFETILEKIK